MTPFWWGFTLGFSYCGFIVGCGRFCGLNQTSRDEQEAIEAERGART